MKYSIFTTHEIAKANMSSIYSNAQFAKKKYVGKFETQFHTRLNSHREDINDSSAVPATRKHFNSPNHDFNTQGKFTIEKLRNITSSSTEILKERLKKMENFWINKLKTVTV